MLDTSKAIGPDMIPTYSNSKRGSGPNITISEKHIYRTVYNSETWMKLQQDLTQLVELARRWQMTLHPAKCFILRVTRKRNPVVHNYYMIEHYLETVQYFHTSVLELSEDIYLDHHISKANRALGFLRGNLHKT
ncbi:Hypothetical predicted protein [Mytilus galloprovincialis]|uniref:Reverse transcriptase domain-containing protein n=1 Tax=Mytilus galloprovincialis TaxID=29158 RepID=A0A8B6EH08_MYTGA|nr:Hypothetical predicted protein [Mytilus galloprovincialis]